MVANDPDHDKLAALDKKLRMARKSRDKSEISPMSMAVRLGAEFVSGVLVGVGMGLLLDNWFNSGPWLLVICMLIGVAAGVKTMMQTVNSCYTSPSDENRSE